MKTLKIGLFGFGCVGQGLYHTLQHSTGFKTRIEKIVVKNREKLRPIGQEFFSYDKNDILENSDINVVIELIDDAEEAYKIVSTALKNGKNVVTANKKMLALHLETRIYPSVLWTGLLRIIRRNIIRYMTSKEAEHPQNVSRSMSIIS